MSYDNVVKFEKYMLQYCSFSDSNMLSSNYIESDSVSFIHAKELNFAYSYDDDKLMTVWADEFILNKIFDYFDFDFDILKKVLKHYYEQMVDSSLFKTSIQDYDTLATGGFIAEYSNVNKKTKSNSLLGLNLIIDFSTQNIIVRIKLNIAEHDSIFVRFDKMLEKTPVIKTQHVFGEKSVENEDIIYEESSIENVLNKIDEHVARKMKEILLINGNVGFKDDIEELKKELLVLTMINY